MKRLLILLSSVLIAAMLAVPVSAHEEDHEDEPDIISPLFCQAPLELAGYESWEIVDLFNILPDDPEHDLLHAGEPFFLFGTLALAFEPSGAGLSLNHLDCHWNDVPIYCWGCVKRDDNGECTHYGFYKCGTHKRHCWTL